MLLSLAADPYAAKKKNTLLKTPQPSPLYPLPSTLSLVKSLSPLALSPPLMNGPKQQLHMLLLPPHELLHLAHALHEDTIAVNPGPWVTMSYYDLLSAARRAESLG